jgi:hypothetical protein
MPKNQKSDARVIMSKLFASGLEGFLVAGLSSPGNHD